ncbi:PilZ domain-containing protein [Desulforhopalus sp. IMCC35007]|uniref:PilZ domain-containing protein n=1 Tax=Desulforhopalus sp. IMCC35007 TaxID=2569543 RepID=UPI0010AE55B6|nr:PilZ domain-containing protein [Desulforhopalus sp. IMCC35007]TKB07138.1 PilZ domain-containing protein [Desulforhopalus sp. IMCC35007]
MSVKKSKVVANIKKNRLYITVADRLSKKEIDSLYTEIRFCVVDLQPGFDVITDFSACTIGVLSGLPTFRKISNHLIASKVGRVVRVIDETKVIQKQFFNYTARSQGYKAETLNSLEEAEEFLSATEDKVALPIRLYERSVAYTDRGQPGEGVITCLSVNGCDIHSATLLPQEGARISLTVTFNAHEDIPDRFELKAKVSWVEDDRFGVEFDDIDADHKDKLWKRLVYESQRDLADKFPQL